MYYCIECNLPHSRNRYGGKPARYCSTRCIKRRWYRTHTKSHSFFNSDKEFWKTETGKAYKWEKYAAKLLKARHLSFNQKGCDLDWNGKKVDVKVSRIYRRKFAHGKSVCSKPAGWWVFNRNKPKPCDFFFCICLKNNRPYKIYMIPNKEFPKSGTTIGLRSCYDIFLWR